MLCTLNNTTCVIAILGLQLLKCLDGELKVEKGDIRSVYNIYAKYDCLMVSEISQIRALSAFVISALPTS